MAETPNLGRGPREGAYQTMASPVWLPLLEGSDAGVTGVAGDRRHPLLDLRMVEFALSLPTIPWCVDKHMFREAARDLLPKTIRKRPKSPLGGDPTPFAIGKYMAGLRKTDAFHPALAQFVDVNRMPEIIDETSSQVYWFALRALILNHWLFNSVR